MSGRPGTVLRRLLLDRCDLEAPHGVIVEVGDTGELAFLVPQPKRLVMSARALMAPDPAVQLRHGLELAWLRSLLPHRPAVCGILAARIAEIYRNFHETNGADSAAPSVLACDLVSLDYLSPLWNSLRLHQSVGADLTGADCNLLRRVWRFAVPTEVFLTSATDQRLTLDPASALNKYGCAPWLQPDMVAFSSCTASSISARSYVHAESARRRLLAQAIASEADAAISETARVREMLLAHFGVGDIADAVLAASGTDAIHFAAETVRAHVSTSPLATILMGLSETGAGVPEAVSPLGTTLHSVALRDAHGFPRVTAAIDAEAARAVAAATDCGRAALYVVDVSKTGLRAPHPHFTADLSRQQGDRLHVIVDACQGRISEDVVRRNLENGHIVVLTGSKFYSGPPFSGVTFIPRARYSHVGEVADLSTLVRWSAALGEMRAFAEVPHCNRAAILRRFGDRARRCISQNPHLMSFDSPEFEDAVLEGWDEQQTIFTFGVRDAAMPGRLLDFDALAQIHRWLYSDLGGYLNDPMASRLCRLGQPVLLGDDGAASVAALRIASGARDVSGEPTRIPFRPHDLAEREIAGLDAVMSKLTLILDNLLTLQRECT